MRLPIARFAAIGALLVCALGQLRNATPARAVTYPSGWNLVSGPDGSTLQGAIDFLYSLRPGESDYELLPASAPLMGCRGYWAYFPDGGSLITAGEGSSRCTVATVPGVYVMIGNPSATQTLNLSGIDIAYTFGPGDSYPPVTSLLPGQGAFAAGQAELVLDVPPSSAPPVAPTPNPTAARPPPASTPVATATVPEVTSVSVVSVQGNSPGRAASLTVQAPAGGSCSISYVTPAGTVSSASGLTPQNVGPSGTVTWFWLIESTSRRGTGSVIVTCVPGGTVRTPITIG